jgi:hypothetical protein
MNQLDLPQLIGLAAALGFASGIRLYLVLFVTGLVGYLQWFALPGGLNVLAHPIVLGASGLMLSMEFLADKFPVIDSIWDSIHTFIRIPAGAALAASVFGGDHTAWATVAAIVGGSLAATSHFTKASTRAVVNTSPEPVSNVAASSMEDVAVGGLLWLAFAHPIAAGVVVLILVLVALWLLPKTFRFIRGMFRRLSGHNFGQSQPPAYTVPEPPRIESK